MTLTITLPIPPKELSPNARVHHHAKARKVKGYRTAAMLAALVELPGGFKPRFKKATAQIDWYAKTARHMDGDNALSSCKALFDGITDSGFLADDRGLTHQPVRFHKDAAHPRVVLTITAV